MDEETSSVEFQNNLSPPVPLGSDEFEKLYSEVAVLQSTIQEVLLNEGNLGNWGLNFNASPQGEFSFANHGKIDFQVIGSSSPVSFLFADDNHPAVKARIIPSGRTSAVQTLRLTSLDDFKQNIHDTNITEDEIQEILANGGKVRIELQLHKLCMVAVKVLGGFAYYRCPTRPGCALWVILFPSDTFNRSKFGLIDRVDRIRLNDIRRNFMLLISGAAAPRDHAKSLLSAFDFYSFKYSTSTVENQSFIISLTDFTFEAKFSIPHMYLTSINCTI